MEVKTAAKAAPRPMDPSQSAPSRVLWIVGGLLAIAGIVAYGLSLGSQTVAGTSSYPWGPYIALFCTAASAGAGLLIVGGIARAARFVTAPQAAHLFSIACALLIAASVFIVVDLGNPAAVMMMYLSANTASPLFFDGIVLPLCIVVTVIGAVVFARSSARESAADTAMAIIGAVVGFALIGVEAWLLTACDGRDAWGVLLGAGPAFLQSAALALAVMVLMGITAKPWRVLMAALFLMVGASLGFDVLLNKGADSVLSLQFAAIAANPLFTVALVAVLAAALVALVVASPLAARVAAGVGALAVLLFKLAVIWGTQAVAAVTGTTIFGAFPFSLTELVVAVGVVGIAVVAYAVAQVVLAKVSAPQVVTAASPATATVDELEFQEVL